MLISLEKALAIAFRNELKTRTNETNIEHQSRRSFSILFYYIYQLIAIIIHHHWQGEIEKKTITVASCVENNINFMV